MGEGKAHKEYEELHARLAEEYAKFPEDGVLSPEASGRIANIQLRLKSLSGREELSPSLRAQVHLDRAFIRNVILDFRPDQPPPKPKRTLAMKLRYVLSR